MTILQEKPYAGVTPDPVDLKKAAIPLVAEATGRGNTISDGGWV